MCKKDTIRISFEVTPHEARLARHWLGRKTMKDLPTASIAKVMHKIYAELNREVEIHALKKGAESNDD